MYAVPDVDEVVAVAKELGIHLGPDEAVKYRKYLTDQMGQLDTFVQARIEEAKPPMVSAARESGYRPSPEEDPLNAWIWKCRIEGEGEGLLAGKTIWYAHDAVMAYKHEDAIPKIQNPCLILANTGDAIYAMSQRTREMRPDFAYQELSGGTIDIIDEQPEQWSAAVASFLQS